MRYRRLRAGRHVTQRVLVSRRSLLAWAAALPFAAHAASAPDLAPGALEMHDGWVLRPGDRARLKLR